jgi:hypothetical protein
MARIMERIREWWDNYNWLILTALVGIILLVILFR